ncbi:MAG: hypothetical protein KGJ93_00895 [Patescibacteria group bacterium]|nr:hypothetical protein [Patescibacteria group bacterium]
MSLKKAYLYLVSVISLVIWVVGAIMLLNLALKTWVFPNADRGYYVQSCPVAPDGKTIACDEAALKKQAEENRSSERQSTAAQALAMIVIAAPVWYFHWRLAKKEV